MSTSGPEGDPGRPGSWAPEIRARYGVRQRPRWAMALVASGSVALLGAATWYAWQLANPEIAAGLTRYSVISDERVEISFEVQRRDPGTALCLVRARASDGFDVGYAEVLLPAQSGRTSHTYQLRTAYRALLGEMLGCGLGQGPEGVAGPQFRPGVLPPEQPWTP